MTLWLCHFSVNTPPPLFHRMYTGIVKGDVSVVVNGDVSTVVKVEVSVVVHREVSETQDLLLPVRSCVRFLGRKDLKLKTEIHLSFYTVVFVTTLSC